MAIRNDEEMNKIQKTNMLFNNIPPVFATYKKHYCKRICYIKETFFDKYAIYKKHFRIFAAENNKVKKYSYDG